MPFRLVFPAKQGARENPDKYLPTAQVCCLFYFLSWCLFLKLFSSSDMFFQTGAPKILHPESHGKEFGEMFGLYFDGHR